MPTNKASQGRRTAAGWCLGALLWFGCSPAEPGPIHDGIVAGSVGARLFYRVVGKAADTVIVVHGGPAFDSRYLEQALSPLASHHALVFYDLRGRGRSTGADARSLSIANDVADLELLRRQLGVSRAHLLGHHWGAAVAMLYAVAHPGEVGRLVLIGPMPHQASLVFALTKLANDSAAMASHDAARAARQEVTDPVDYCRRFWGFALSPVEETAPPVIRRLAPTLCAESPAVLRRREGVQRALYRSLQSWDWSDSLKKVSAPVLVIVGNRSPALLAGARVWAADAEQGRLLQAGETPWFPWLEARDRVIAVIDEFLLGIWPPGAEIVARSNSLAGQP